MQLRTPFPTHVLAATLIFAMGLACRPAASSAAPSAGNIVTKEVDGFDFANWQQSQSSTASGEISRSDDAPPDAASRHSLLAEPQFIGSFAGMTVSPASPLVVPGQMTAISLRLKLSDPHYEVKVSFRDGWGREIVDGKYLSWGINTKNAINQWSKAGFKIPSDWVQPIEITGIGLDNWEAKTEKKTVQLNLAQIEVTTDISSVDPNTGALTTWSPQPNPPDPKKALQSSPKAPLVQVELSTPSQANVFAGVEPSATVAVRNWKPGNLTGEFKYQVHDERGLQIAADTQSIEATDMAGFQLPLKANRFGLFTLQGEISLSDGTTRNQSLSYAHIPAPRELTQEQKLSSPYGLNNTGAGQLIIKPFRQAGIVWFREYSFSYPWLLKARHDGAFTGWPFYPSMVQAYMDAGAELMPVLQKSISKPELKDGKPIGELGPDTEWGRNIASVLLAFPQIKYWEVSNEYDFPAENSSAEQAVNWENYEKYHARFAQLVDLFGGGNWTTVENGHPGIFPDIEAKCVQSGFFDKVGVVNSHYYTGTFAPEESVVNYNTHPDVLLRREPGFLFDQLRAATRAGRSDGKNRQHWLTEFGWDTLAGPIVSPFEQAVFLQRGWMLAMSAGCEKAFWFYNFDSDKPLAFFDGCGLFTHDLQPKLSFAAMAGLTSILPTPQFLGTINVGDNTAGYVFRQDGKLVAALFTIRGDGPLTSFQAERLYDYLGNPLPGTSAKLSMAPVYAVGLGTLSNLYKQSAYALDTPYLIGATAGDPINPAISISNTRADPIQCDIRPQIPQGWSIAQPDFSATVQPGQTRIMEIPIVVGTAEPNGQKSVKFAIAEASEPIKEITLKVNLQPAIAMRVSPITGAPGETTLNIQLANSAATPRDGVLTLKLPASWQTPQPQITISNLQPGEARNVPITFSWNINFTPGESATVQFTDTHGASIVRPLIPSEFSIHFTPGISLDADPTAWPPNTEVPSWMLGSLVDETGARVHLAWAKEGIYAAVEVHDSKIVNHDPDSFWACDALEMFVDTAGNKSPRPFAPTDHQFWFVPQPDKNTVYAGRWKVATEIPPPSPICRA